MTRDELADELLEIRRYVRTDVEHVRERLIAIACEPMFSAVRLLNNLDIGLKYIQVDPEVLEGYLYAAAFELRCGRKDQSS